MNIEKIDVARKLFAVREELSGILDSFDNDVMEIEIKGNGNLLMIISNVEGEHNYLNSDHRLRIIYIIKEYIKKELFTIEEQIKEL